MGNRYCGLIWCVADDNRPLFDFNIRSAIEHNCVCRRYGECVLSVALHVRSTFRLAAATIWKASRVLDARPLSFSLPEHRRGHDSGHAIDRLPERSSSRLWRCRPRSTHLSTYPIFRAAPQRGSWLPASAWLSHLVVCMIRGRRRSWRHLQTGIRAWTAEPHGEAGLYDVDAGELAAARRGPRAPRNAASRSVVREFKAPGHPRRGTRE